MGSRASTAQDSQTLTMAAAAVLLRLLWLKPLQQFQSHPHHC